MKKKVDLTSLRRSVLHGKLTLVAALILLNFVLVAGGHDDGEKLQIILAGGVAHRGADNSSQRGFFSAWTAISSRIFCIGV